MYDPQKIYSAGTRALRGSLCWIVPGAGWVLVFGILFSPWFTEKLDQLFDSTIRVDAHVTSCELQRDGRRHENVIRCVYNYEFEGTSYQNTSVAWRNENSFSTLGGLDRTLAEQSAMRLRVAAIYPRSPQEANLVDDRWLTTPPFYVFLILCALGLLTLVVILDANAKVFKRADMVVDAGTGELVYRPDKTPSPNNVRLLLKPITALAFVVVCVYGLSNAPANALGKFGLTGLQAVAAKLIDCKHRRNGTYKGHYQIDCAFEYQFNDQTLRGTAESLDFRNFPTQARMDAEVAKFQPTVSITALVDPGHPTYARAFISNDWWVTYTWGPWELQLVFALPIALLCLFITAKAALRSTGETRR